MTQADDQGPPRAAEDRPLSRFPWAGYSGLLGCAFLIFSTGCALPPPPPRQALEISGTVSGIDVEDRFFYLESDGERPRVVYWDDMTRFSSGGREIAPSHAGRMLGESVAVLAVPMGGKMVANSCNEL